jgi:hypothetical protein
MTQRLLLLLATLVLLAGCAGATAADDGVATIDDGSSGAAGSSPAPTASVDPEDAMLAFARCMREHGVDMPDPAAGGGGGLRGTIKVGGGDGIDPKDFQAANEACREHLSGVLGGEGPAGLSPEDQDRLLEFAECMRDHGIDMPDPQFDGGGGAFSIGGPDADIDFDSPEFQAAQEACRDLLPGRTGGPDGNGPTLEGQSGSGTDNGPGTTIQKVEP